MLLTIVARWRSTRTNVPPAFAVGSGTSDFRIARYGDKGFVFASDGCWRTRWCGVFSSGSGRSVSFGVVRMVRASHIRRCAHLLT